MKNKAGGLSACPTFEMLVRSMHEMPVSDVKGKVCSTCVALFQVEMPSSESQVFLILSACRLAELQSLTEGGWASPANTLASQGRARKESCSGVG